MRIAFNRLVQQPNGLYLVNLWVMRGDGTHQTQLTSYTSPWDQPHEFVWTPDGSKIIYVFAYANGDDVWVMNADGTAAHRLFTVDGNVAGLDISPDGQTLVYSHYSPALDGYGIFLRSADGSGVDRLLLAGGYTSPRWSPDGGKIAFDNAASGDAPRVYEMNADGTNQVSLTTNEMEYGPVWSPDGTKLIYSSTVNGSGNPVIWEMNADGTSKTQITFPGPTVDTQLPAWGPRPAAAIKLDTLLAYVATLPPGNSLAQKVTSVQAAFAEGAGSYDNTCNKTNAVINEANSETGTTLTRAQAAEVTAETNAIRALLQCS
jgi:Tol biopolymer transport system component